MRDREGGSLNRREAIVVLAAAAAVPLVGRHAFGAAEDRAC